MAEHTIKMPDVGEGVAEAELVEWHVKVGDPVREDMVLAAVMTDKATVEIPSPVDGEVAWLGGEIGDRIAVGAPIVRLKTAGGASAETSSQATPTPGLSPQGGGESAGAAGRKKQTPAPKQALEDGPRDISESPSPLRGGVRGGGSSRAAAPRPAGEKPLASPAVRLRAKEAGVDLRQVAGAGPAGRITHDDLDAFLRGGAGSPAGPARAAADTSVEEIKVVGLRRRIAERMETAHARIVPITYVEEVDVTALEELRAKLNSGERAANGAERPKLTLLPFLMRAMVAAVRQQPHINAHYDDQAGIVRRFGGVHVGIATQTDAGLMVPVVRHVEARDVWGCATEVARLSEAARSGTASREELTGSTITITSLGALGGIVTTPVINHPEVAIIGVNRMAVRPLWDGKEFVPRKVMNLSSTFDHRIVDGWDAAVFVQKLKALMETPALIFMEG
jgi:2-oxoisovalerate dehydrogenase E2 component (dihydrolipoyl transacylase)